MMCRPSIPGRMRTAVATGSLVVADFPGEHEAP